MVQRLMRIGLGLVAFALLTGACDGGRFTGPGQADEESAQEVRESQSDDEDEAEDED